MTEVNLLKGYVQIYEPRLNPIDLMNELNF